MKKKLITLLLVFAIIFTLPLTYLEAKEKIPTVKNFKATKIGTESVTLSWKKVSKISGYQIQMKMDGEPFFPEKTIKKASKTSYRSNELSPGEKYTFRIRAYKKAGKKKIYSAWKKTTVVTKTNSSDSEDRHTTTTEQNTTIEKNTETSTRTNDNTNTNIATTEAQVTTEAQTTTKKQITTEAQTTTETQVTTEAQTTTETQVTTEAQATTPTTNTVYTTKTGKKYHSTRNCRGLNNANNIYEKSESDAINNGLTRCDLCY